MIIKNARIFDGDKFIPENVVILSGNRIEKITTVSELNDELMSKHEIVDIEGKVLSPGFIDLQINGCGGALFNDEITVKTLEIMNETNKKYGCTSFLPTLITSPDEKILKALELINEIKDTKEEIGVLGLHIEGPYISVEKKGVHRPDYIRVLDDKVIDEIAKIGYDGVKIITVAPENALVKHLKILKESGINIALGHTNATYAQIEEKSEYFTHATHFFNAMRGFDSREPGAVGYLLDKKNVQCGIIVDGLHASFPSVRVVKEVMRSNLYLVTDAVSPMGTDMKEFIFEGHLVRHENGKCWDPKTGSLGGSALDMITGVKNLIKEVKVSEEEALRMATSYPAKAVQVDDRYGYIKEGYIADLTFYNSDYKVEGTISKGKLQRY
ncbi:N-acetylglucosamine-6-phosphate deacetylase [Streptobacillus moniliformis]|uniref:N-acetylglucosamine-6-phosphate deacetylase n=1 Tax=Streptobacillus moniliformis TaxID=34105 RepID=UPI0007E3F27A|nr:N-acetylglucosamine-6-phosphate deacetylase [Streptobacillus moniliformis]